MIGLKSNLLSNMEMIAKENNTVIKTVKKFIDRIDLCSYEFLFSDERRNELNDRFDSILFPTSRSENWKYTRTTKITNANYKLQSTHSIDPLAIEEFLIDGVSGSVLVFVNGFYDLDLSIIIPESGVSISPIHRVDKEWFDLNTSVSVDETDHSFTALNTFLATNGAAIEISKATCSNNTIQLLFISTGEKVISNIRNSFVISEGASAHVVMNFASIQSDGCFSSIVSEVQLAANSNFTIDKIQQLNNSDFQIAVEQINKDQDAVFTLNTSTISGAIIRNDVNVLVEGVNSETNLYGVYVLNENQHVDNHTVVDHKVAHCLSNELYKGVLKNASTAVFNGKVFVRKDAQKTNAFQSNATVLLSDDSTMNSKPELEIYADDVKCSHGSTTGQLDDEAIFYLTTRGISLLAAKQLLVDAFMDEALTKTKNEYVLDYIRSLLARKQTT